MPFRFAGVLHTVTPVVAVGDRPKGPGVVLVRSDLLKPVEGVNPSCVALLSSRTDSETLLRVAAYPERGFVYCGLWRDNDLLLGWSEIEFVQRDNRTFAASVVDVFGRSDMSIRLLANWEKPCDSSGPRPTSADAQILDMRGKIVDRLILTEAGRCDSPRPNADGSSQARSLRLVATRLPKLHESTPRKMFSGGTTKWS